MCSYCMSGSVSDLVVVCLCLCVCVYVIQRFQAGSESTQFMHDLQGAARGLYQVIRVSGPLLSSVCMLVSACVCGCGCVCVCVCESSHLKRSVCVCVCVCPRT